MLGAPSAAAWRVEPVQVDAVPPLLVDWLFAWGHASRAAGGNAHARADVVCALGDVDADGSADILVRTRGSRGNGAGNGQGEGNGGVRMRALAGPEFQRVLWTVPLDEATLLRCAPDVNGDAVADPVTEAVVVPEPTLPLPVGEIIASEAAPITAEVNGTTGQPIVAIETTESTTSIEVAPLGPGIVTTGATSDATLEPAALDMILHVVVETTSVEAVVPVLGGDVGSETTSVSIEVLDASGTSQGTIAPADPAAQIVEFAPAPGEGATNVVVLTTVDAASSSGAGPQRPTTSLYAPDGGIVWSHEHETTTGEPILVPNAGDVDGDGTQDIIVVVTSPELGVGGPSTIEVLSGDDGTQVYSDAATEGDIAALPLGNVTPSAGDEILVVEQSAPDAPIVVTCVDRAGAACWSAELPAGAAPVNARTDPFSGEITGFEDLTGDGVPDVAVAIADGTGSSIQVVDGASGEIAWTAPVPAGSSVVVLATPEGSDLVVHAPVGAGFSLARLDGRDGTTTWSATSDEGEVADVATSDLDGDGTDDLLVTISTGPEEDEEGGSIMVVNGVRGATAWKTPIDESSEAPDDLQVASSAPAASAATLGARIAGVALPVLAGILAIVGIFEIAATARRRSR